MYVIKSTTHEFMYIGSTNDIDRRLYEHNSGFSIVTKAYRPYSLITYVAVQTEAQARRLEKYFKTGSGKSVLLNRIIG
ncbi:MAG: GIY-YIG nuclease family protein [Chitinophagaceae bacterium]|nr:GIY-YIG nuclease family protein [Chitinophagaceae bacterium]